MNCDVCGKAVRFSARAFKLRNGAEITICASCVVESKPTNPASSGIAERAKKKLPYGGLPEDENEKDG